MKKILVLFAAMAVSTGIYAQSKVFKEVNSDISSESKTIFSGGSVIGYVVFTQLEKASQDSFNYKLSIMDENLNDIGVVEFREIGLYLRAISFEEDVLCLSYIKSTELGKDYTKYKEVKKKESKDFVMTQFINLDGKILNTENISVTTSGSFSNSGYGRSSSYSYNTRLKKGLQLEGLKGQGFLMFYGDDNSSKLVKYGLDGKQLWTSSMADAESYYLNTAGSNIYMLMKNEKYTYGDYTFTSIDAATGKVGKTRQLQDKEGNQLRVRTFEADPQSGNLYIAGSIINNKRNKVDPRIKVFAKAMTKGVFTIDMDSTAKNGMKEKYVYWSDGSLQPDINKLGYTKSNKSYNVISTTYRDYNGNTYFVTDELRKHVRVGGIISSVVFAPLIVVPFMQAALGYNVYTYNNTNIFKLTPKGALLQENEIKMKRTPKGAGKADINYLSNYRSNYSLANEEAKTTYLVASDSKTTQIYSTEKRKIIRTVPYSKDGSTMLIGPAKEGHIMVIEKNTKEKYTRLSIERLD